MVNLVRHLVIVAVIALAACRSAAKPDGSGRRSASRASAATLPAVAAPDSATPPGGATTAPVGTQPQRSAADAARVSEVEHAIEQAITSAKQAKTLKEACNIRRPSGVRCGVVAFLRILLYGWLGDVFVIFAIRPVYPKRRRWVARAAYPGHSQGAWPPYSSSSPVFSTP